LVLGQENTNSRVARQVLSNVLSGQLAGPLVQGRQSSGSENLMQALIELKKGAPNLEQGANARTTNLRLPPQPGAGPMLPGPQSLAYRLIPTTLGDISPELVQPAKQVDQGVLPKSTLVGRLLGHLLPTILPSQQRQYDQPESIRTEQGPRAAWQSIIQKPDLGTTRLGAGKQGGSMLSPEGINMMSRPNTVYVEGAAAGVRLEPEQARTLGLRAGETINAVVTQRQDGNILLIGKQQIPLPDRMNLPAGQVSLMVRVVAGQMVLALTDPALAAQVAAGAQRTDADNRFARLLNHIGSFHLSRTLGPGFLTGLTEQSGNPQLQRGLAALLLDSRQLSAGSIRTAVEGAGLFGEHQASLNSQQAAPGLKSMLLSLRALMQARQMETTSISGAIDELEARQLDSLAQQTAGRTHYSWVLPFADQYPVYIELEHQQVAGNEENSAQSVWSIDLQVGLTSAVAMAANVRVDQEGGLGLRLWLPDPTFYRVAQQSRGQLEEMVASQGLSLTGLTVYPVARDAGMVDDSRPRVGVLLDA